MKSLLITLFASLFLLSPVAFSWTAANAVINNETIVEFEYSGQTYRITESVSVTTGLTACQPQITFSDQTFNYTPLNNVQLNVRMTACANGPDQYLFNAAISSRSNNQQDDAIISGAEQRVSLGASAALSSSNNRRIFFPADDDISDNVINGLAVGDQILINEQTRMISSLSESVDESWIDIDEPLSEPVELGQLILETIDLGIIIYPGSISDSDERLTLRLQLSASNSSVSNFSETYSLGFLAGNATVASLMRNLTSDAGNALATGATVLSVNGTNQTYFSEGVQVASNDLVEYVFIVENTGTGPLRDSLVQKDIPADELVLSPIISAQQALLIHDGQTWEYLSISDDDRLVQQFNDAENTTELLIDLGNDFISGFGGTIDSGSTWMIVYRVRVL